MSKISEEEKNKRLAANAFSRASIALEGLKAPDAYDIQALRYANGEITHDQLLVFVEELSAVIRASNY
jgi:uncharacterized membrane protein